jgi:RNA polymerase sigma-70 factor (ECF subfamily)
MRPKEREASPAGPDDDWVLVRRVVDREDLRAFDALVVRHQDRIFGLIARMVPDQEAARDLTQDTFLKAFKGLRGFSGEASFYTWLYRIARNVVTSHARYQAARPRISASLDAEDPDRGPLRVVLAAPAKDPVEGAIESERRAMLLAALAALSPEFREIIVLRDFEDRSYEEIAELLEVPPGTVRSRLHRARADLRERLKPILADPGRSGIA